MHRSPYAEILRTDCIQNNLMQFIRDFCAQFTDTANTQNFIGMFEAVCDAKLKDATLYMLNHPMMQKCSYELIIKCMCIWINHCDVGIVESFVEFALTNPDKACYRSTFAFEALRAACYNQDAGMCGYMLFESDLSVYLSGQLLRPFYEPLRSALIAEDFNKLGELFGKN